MLAVLVAVVSGAAHVPVADATGTCPNESIRVQQQSTYLPDCRAYEQVSPVDKNGTDVQNFVRTSADGHSVAWSSLGAYADTPGVNALAFYVARRAPAGWRTIPRNPRWLDDNDPDTVNLYDSSFFSDDLSTQIFSSQGNFDPADHDKDPYVHFGSSDTYTLDEAGNLTFISHGEAGMGNGFFQPAFVHAASGDGKTIFFQSAEALVPDAPNPPSGELLYRWRDGHVDAVGKDTNDTVLSSSFVGHGFTFFSNNGSGDAGVMPDSDAVSRDGTRFGYSGDGGRLFFHKDGHPNTEIGLSQRSGAVGQSAPASFGAAVQDVTKIVFWSAALLTDDAPVPAGDSGNFYVYDTTTGTLRYLMPGETPAFSYYPHILKLSDDLDYIYYLDRDVLAPGATEGSLNLYVRSAAGVRFVGTVEGTTLSFAATSLNNSATALSSDGKTLLFSSTGPVTDAPTNGNEQVYRYDAALGQTTCLTCGAAAKGSTIRPYNENSTPAPTSLLDDGTVVVTTADAHSPRDTNGKNDVYSYRDGAWSLMSDGTSKYGTTHVGASADGEDIYIMTRSALVGQDNDTGNMDVYDVRRNGGFAEAVQGPGGCLSDACQPMPTGRPAAMAPATDRTGGGGNAPAPVRATLSARRPSTGQLRALARGKVIVLSATVSRPGLVRATLTGVTAGTTRRLATVSATAKRAGNVRLRLRLSSAGQRLLRTRRSLQTTLSFTVAGAPLLRLSSLRLDRA